MAWQKVAVSDYRLNARNLKDWLKAKWGDYDYAVEVDFSCKASLQLVDVR
jgi:hypothetical protein